MFREQMKMTWKLEQVKNQMTQDSGADSEPDDNGEQAKMTRHSGAGMGIDDSGVSGTEHIAGTWNNLDDGDGPDEEDEDGSGEEDGENRPDEEDETSVFGAAASEESTERAAVNMESLG